MTHIAIQGQVDGKNVRWMEKVSDELYDASSNALPPEQRLEDVRRVAPALERYTQGTVLGELWRRPDLSPRDRGLITVAALIARNQAIEMPFYFNPALDDGVKPSELSEVIMHLAFYSGWPNAMSAVAAAKGVFGQRGIGVDQLPPASGEVLPIDEAVETQRAARVEQEVGPVAPGVVQYTSHVLFDDLWPRPALAPRDRSLVTVSGSSLQARSRNSPST